MKGEGRRGGLKTKRYTVDRDADALKCRTLRVSCVEKASWQCRIGSLFMLAAEVTARDIAAD